MTTTRPTQRQAILYALKHNILCEIQAGIVRRSPQALILQAIRYAVWCTDDLQKLTRAERAELSGYQEGLLSFIRQTMLEYRLTLPDGTWVDAHLYPYDTVDCHSYEMMCAYFWRRSNDLYDEPSPACS